MNFTKLKNQLEIVFFKSLPTLSKNIKHIIVLLLPYLAIISVVLFLSTILAIFRFGAISLPTTDIKVIKYFTNFFLSTILIITNTIVTALAIPGLFVRTYRGWQFMFVSTLLGAISNLISLNLGSLIIGATVGLYLLFQVKSYYK